MYANALSAKCLRYRCFLSYSTFYRMRGSARRCSQRNSLQPSSVTSRTSSNITRHCSPPWRNASANRDASSTSPRWQLATWNMWVCNAIRRSLLKWLLASMIRYQMLSSSKPWKWKGLFLICIILNHAQWENTRCECLFAMLGVFTKLTG